MVKEIEVKKVKTVQNWPINADLDHDHDFSFHHSKFDEWQGREAYAWNMQWNMLYICAAYFAKFHILLLHILP